jgi:hypothetical protein
MTMAGMPPIEVDPPNGNLREIVERLVEAVDGCPRKDIMGLRPRVKELEDMAKKWRELSMMAKGMALGLAFNLLATVGILIAIWRLAAEVASRTVP